MLELFDQLCAAMAAGRPVAYCRLVETRGSTPQKAGAMMLVHADGSQAGTLGGGCVEAEVKRRALGILAQGRPEIAKFSLDSDYGWDDGLICGGRMHILVTPLPSPGAAEYFQRLRDMAHSEDGGTEAVVFDAQASGLHAPTCLLFDAAERLIAQYAADSQPLGSEQLASLVEQIQPVVERLRPYAAHGVSFLPLLPRCRLIIVGGGHVGLAVANLAADLDFDVWWSTTAKNMSRPSGSRGPSGGLPARSPTRCRSSRLRPARIA
jgi:xanthine dehydrogenase accessory factor